MCAGIKIPSAVRGERGRRGRRRPARPPAPPARGPARRARTAPRSPRASTRALPGLLVSVSLPLSAFPCSL